MQLTWSTTRTVGRGWRRLVYGAAMVTPPVAAAIGATVMPWTGFLWSTRRAPPPWHGPWSLLLLGWPGWVVVGWLITASLIAVGEAMRPGSTPLALMRCWRVGADFCFGGAAAGLMLVSSRFAEIVGARSLTFGLGSWDGMGSGMELFLMATAVWVAVAEWGMARRAPTGR